MSCRRESYRREFIPVLVPERDFHPGTKIHAPPGLNYRIQGHFQSSTKRAGSFGSFALLSFTAEPKEPNEPRAKRAKRATKYRDLGLNEYRDHSSFFHPLPSQTSQTSHEIYKPKIYRIYRSFLVLSSTA